MATPQTEAFMRTAIKPKGGFADIINQLLPIFLEFFEMWLSSCTFSPADAVEKASNPGIVSLIVGQRKLMRACRRERDFSALPVGQQRGIVVGVFDDVSSAAVDQPELVEAAYNSLAG